MSSLSQYLLGVAELAVIAAALGLGAFYVRALLVPSWNGALARLAEVVLGVSALVVISELLGLVGLFKEIPLVIACVAVGLGGAYLGRARQAAGVHEAPEVRSSPLMIAIAVLAAVVVVTHWSQPTQESLDRGMYYQDSTWYHMSFSARFDEAGEVGPLHFTDPLKITAWFYPQNNELLHGVGIVALDNDFLSPLVNLVWLAVALLAAWCIGRPYAVGAVTLLGAAVVLDSEMMVGTQAGNAPNDIAGVAFLLAAIAFIVNGAATTRAAPRRAGETGPPAAPPEPEAPRIAGGAEDATKDLRFPEHPEPGVIEDVPVAGDPRALAGVGAGPLFLGGLAAGLGVGTKVTLLATLGALTIGIAVLGGRQNWWRAAGIWLAGMGITAAFWYGRNLVFAANPFPQIDKLGPIDIPGPQQIFLYPRSPHSLSEYYNDPLVWENKLLPVLDDRLGPLWPVILATAVVALVMALFWGRSSLMRVLAVTGMVAGVAYVFTPLTASGDSYSPAGFDANLRYVAPVLIISFVLLPLVPAVRHSRREWILMAFLAILFIQGTVTQPNWKAAHLDESIEVALLIVGVPALMVAAARRGVRPAAIAAFGLAALAVTVALGRTQEQQYLEQRYVADVAPPLTGGFRASENWPPLQDWGHETEDSRIAVVGRASAFGQYFFYGNDLSNHVQYIGQELRRGTFRPIKQCGEFRRAINDGDYDYLVSTPLIGRSEEKAPLEDRWAGADPNTEAIIRSGPAAVYRIDGTLDPDTCSRLGDNARYE
jgi:hypothetical protein